MAEMCVSLLISYVSEEKPLILAVFMRWLILSLCVG